MVPTEVVALRQVTDSFQAAADAEAARSGEIVTAVCTSGRVCYPRDWGCPDDGEPVVTITGNRNPQRQGDPDAWRAGVLNICETIAEMLDQVTVQVAFT